MKMQTEQVAKKFAKHWLKLLDLGLKPGRVHGLQSGQSDLVTIDFVDAAGALRGSWVIDCNRDLRTVSISGITHRQTPEVPSGFEIAWQESELDLESLIVT